MAHSSTGDKMTWCAYVLSVTTATMLPIRKLLGQTVWFCEPEENVAFFFFFFFFFFFLFPLPNSVTAEMFFWNVIITFYVFIISNLYF